MSAFRSRFELKYLIEPRYCDQVRRFIEPFMQPDPYAARHSNNTYPICSLYLDSPDLRLYNQVLSGEKNRFKLRIRTYSDDRKTPAFVEVKTRMNQILHKRRAALDRDSVKTLLEWDLLETPPGLADGLVQDLDQFTSRRLLMSARPVMRVKYMREAYESRAGDPLRVTFDTGLCHAVTMDDNLSMAEGEWVETPVKGVILEIKYTDRFPAWVTDLAHMFQLSARSVPKYVMSVQRALESGQSYVGEIDTFTSLPQGYRHDWIE